MAKPLFNENDRVWSPIYGDGKVVRVDHYDDTIKVDFGGNGFGGITSTAFSKRMSSARWVTSAPCIPLAPASSPRIALRRGTAKRSP